MLALSIRQPWAWLILNAGKDIENRNWHTNTRDRILVHAAKGMTRDEYDDARYSVLCPESGIQHLEFPEIDSLWRGGIIGSVEIVDCVNRSNSPWFYGRWGFVLRNPQPLPFRPYRGQLGFFDVAAAA